MSTRFLYKFYEYKDREGGVLDPGSWRADSGRVLHELGTIQAVEAQGFGSSESKDPETFPFSSPACGCAEFWVTLDSFQKEGFDVSILVPW